MNNTAEKKPEVSEKDSIMSVSRESKYRTVGELLEKSRPNEIYYVLLILSSIIIAGGILTNNLPIIIGGMLVTPLLSPILTIALALATGQVDLMKKTSMLLLKSVVAVIIGSAVLGFIFGGDVQFPQVVDSMTATFLYFIIALSSGVAVTYAWIRKEASEILPGIAIVVSLVPPLSYIGVGLSRGAFDTALTFFIIFVLNMIGIILGSLAVFLISQFSQIHKAVERKHEKITEEEEKAKEERLKKQAEEKLKKEQQKAEAEKEAAIKLAQAIETTPEE